VILVAASACGSSNPSGGTCAESPDSECVPSTVSFTSCAELGLPGGNTVVDCTDECTWDRAVCVGGPGNVTVRVTTDGTPSPDTTVAIGDTTLATDANGEASTTVDGNTEVTVANVKPSGNVELVSYLEVPAGTTIAVDFPGLGGSVAPAGNVRLTWANTPAGTTTIKTSTGCGSNTASVSSNIPLNHATNESCMVAPSMASLYVEALDGTGVPLGYQYFPSIAVDPATPVDLVADTWQTTLTPMELTVTDVPASAVDLTFMYWFLAGTVVNYSPFQQLIPSPAPGSTQMRSKLMPPASVVTRVQATVTIDEDRGATRVQLAPGPYTFDGHLFLPRFTSCTSDTSDPARPGIAFTLDTPTGNPDVLVAWFYFTLGSNFLTWRVNAPPTGTSIHVPALPADPRWAPFDVPNRTQVQSSTRTSLLDMDIVADYLYFIGGIDLDNLPYTTYSSTAFPSVP